MLPCINKEFVRQIFTKRMFKMGEKGSFKRLGVFVMSPCLFRMDGCDVSSGNFLYQRKLCITRCSMGCSRKKSKFV